MDTELWEIPYPQQFYSWELFYPVRVWTTNQDRNLHHFQRAALIKQWRSAFKEIAENANIPELAVMFVEATPQVPTRRNQDTSACNPAVKAAIDGITDAGVIPDDSKEWLKWILFRPCVYVKNEPGLRLKIVGLIK